MHFKIAGVVCFFLAVSTLTLAQKNEFSISAGAVATSDQQTRLIGITCPVGFPNCAGPVTTTTDTGVAFEGDYVRQIFNLHLASIGAEFPIVGVPHRDVTMTSAAGIPISPRISSQSSVFFTPSARVELLPSGRISPFFSLGGGWAHYEQANSINRGALQFGGGQISKHLCHTSRYAWKCGISGLKRSPKAEALRVLSLSACTTCLGEEELCLSSKTQPRPGHGLLRTQTDSD